MNIEDEARQEAERRWPHTGDTTVDIRRSALRHTFVKGVKWASEQPDREPSDAEVLDSARAVLSEMQKDLDFDPEYDYWDDAMRYAQAALRIARGEDTP